MAHAHFVKKARKAIPGTDIKKGDSYYWWKFRYGGKHVSKKRPRISQLTNSPFLSSVWAVFESLEDLTYNSDLDEIRSAVGEAVSELENLADECETSLANMPEGLQEGPTGQLLQDRADQVRDLAFQLESIDIPDDPEDEEKREDQADDEDDSIAAVVDEIQAISYEGE